MRRALLALPLTLALLAGCSSGSTGPSAAPSGPSGPKTLQPAAPTTAPGTRRVTCSVSTDDGKVRLAFDLPDTFKDAGDCRWKRPVGFKPESPGTPTVVSVSRVGADKDRTATTAREMYDEQKPFLVADGDFAGDDTIYDLVYQHDVPVFGATTGDRVSWECYCDGAPYVEYVVQAAGIELGWTSVPDIRARTEAELSAALASAGSR